MRTIRPCIGCGKDTITEEQIAQCFDCKKKMEWKYRPEMMAFAIAQKVWPKRETSVKVIANIIQKELEDLFK